MAFPNDSSRIARGIGNLETAATDYANAAGAQAPARPLIRKTYHIAVASVFANNDDAIVANAAAAVFFKNPARIMGVTVIPRGPTIGNISNFVTHSLRGVAYDGTNGNIIAVRKTNTVASGGPGNLANGQAFSLTVDSANARVAANTYVGPVVTSATAGILASAATWAIDVEEEGPDLYAV